MNDSSNDNDNFYTNSNSSFYNFDSFVDPSMLLPEDIGSFGGSSELDLLDSIPALPTEIPSITETPSTDASPNSPSAAIRGPGSLYDKLTCPASPALANSPTLYPYGSPYSMGSPSTLMMSATPVINSTVSTEPSWMHSTRPRRRRSSYASPSLMPQGMPAQSPYGMMMSTPSQMGLGFNAMNMPYGAPMMASPHMYPHPFMMAPTMSPMNVTVKLPMAPLTPTNYSSSSDNSNGGSMKIPLVLPCHLQQQQQPAQANQNSAAPNVSKLQTVTSSELSSGVPSRCSSIAPNSSISSRSLSSQQNWFTEMSATKDKFLRDVESIDFTNVTVLELKQVLRKFGLNSTGKKVQLVERITEISNFLKTEGRKRAKIDASDSTGTETDVLSCSASVISTHSSQIAAV